MFSKPLVCSCVVCVVCGVWPAVWCICVHGACAWCVCVCGVCVCVCVCVGVLGVGCGVWVVGCGVCGVVCVCVCTVLDHERRGSLPTTCCCISTWIFPVLQFSCRGHSHHVLLLCQQSWQTLVRISGRDAFQTYLQNRSGPCADQIRKARPLSWQIRAEPFSATQQHVHGFQCL